MKKCVFQGASIAALSVVFIAGSLVMKPGMAFGYGYGHETPSDEPKETVTPTDNSTKNVDKDEKRDGKKYRSYREYREKYKSGRLVYLKLRSYKRSSDPELVRQFTERQAIYQMYAGQSVAKLQSAQIDNATLLKYLEYKQYRGYKKYKELKNDLGI